LKRLDGLCYPTGICVDEDGNIYCGIRYEKCIYIFDKYGTKINTLPVAETPLNIDASCGKLYVICFNNAMQYNIVVYDLNTSKEVSNLGYGKSNGIFTGICVDYEGNIVVADWKKSKIQVFDPKFKLLGEYASEHPCYVHVDNYGDIIFTQRDTGAVESKLFNHVTILHTGFEE